MHLAWDICRCRGIDANDQTCTRRNGCHRYIAAVNNNFGPRTPCSNYLCHDGQDSLIEYVGQARDG